MFFRACIFLLVATIMQSSSYLGPGVLFGKFNQVEHEKFLKNTENNNCMDLTVDYYFWVELDRCITKDNVNFYTYTMVFNDDEEKLEGNNNNNFNQVKKIKYEGLWCEGDVISETLFYNKSECSLFFVEEVGIGFENHSKVEENDQIRISFYEYEMHTRFYYLTKIQCGNFYPNKQLIKCLNRSTVEVVSSLEGYCSDYGVILSNSQLYLLNSGEFVSKNGAKTNIIQFMKNNDFVFLVDELKINVSISCYPQQTQSSHFCNQYCKSKKACKSFAGCECEDNQYGKFCQFEKFYCGNYSNVDPLQCSGHGICLQEEKCICYDGYIANPENNHSCIPSETKNSLGVLAINLQKRTGHTDFEIDWETLDNIKKIKWHRLNWESDENSQNLFVDSMESSTFFYVTEEYDEKGEKSETINRIVFPLGQKEQQQVVKYSRKKDSQFFIISEYLLYTLVNNSETHFLQFMKNSNPIPPGFNILVEFDKNSTEFNKENFNPDNYQFDEKDVIYWEISTHIKKTKYTDELDFSLYCHSKDEILFTIMDDCTHFIYYETGKIIKFKENNVNYPMMIKCPDISYPVCYNISSFTRLHCNKRGECIDKDVCKCLPGIGGDKCDEIYCNGIHYTNESACGGIQNNCLLNDVCICEDGYINEKGTCIENKKENPLGVLITKCEDKDCKNENSIKVWNPLYNAYNNVFMQYLDSKQIMVTNLEYQFDSLKDSSFFIVYVNTIIESNENFIFTLIGELYSFFSLEIKYLDEIIDKNHRQLENKIYEINYLEGDCKGIIETIKIFNKNTCKDKLYSFDCDRKNNFIYYYPTYENCSMVSSKLKKRRKLNECVKQFHYPSKEVVYMCEKERIFCGNFEISDTLACSGNGECIGENNCKCNFGYFGEECEQKWITKNSIIVLVLLERFLY